ncbi:MAG: class I SAM-dependent methyltransferase, partial [bacterium]
LPEARQVEAVLGFAKAKNVPMTLVTPIAGEASAKKAEKLLETLPRGSEVVFNDFGLLEHIKSLGLVPILGRMLVMAADGRPPFQDLCGPRILQARYADKLKELGVARVEIDNAAQVCDLKPVAGIPVSIYYPFVCREAPGKCAFGGAAAESSDSGGGIVFLCKCDKKCGKRILKAYKNGVAVSIIGNASFYFNDVPPGNLEALGIDRMVYMPVLPYRNSEDSDIETLDWSFPYKTGAYGKSWGTLPDKTVEKLVLSISASEGSRVLDVGCGAGRNAPVMIKSGLRYTGIDIAAEAIELARRKLPGVNFILGDALNHDWAGSLFDIAIDYGCFHTLPPWKRNRYFELMNSIVKPGGHLIAAAWDGPKSAVPIEYVCGNLPEWACPEAEYKNLASPDFQMIHTELREEGKWILRYYVMRKISAK